jgi:hypothetical protein
MQRIEVGDEPVLELPLQKLLQGVRLVLRRHHRRRRLLRARLHGDHREAGARGRGAGPLHTKRAPRRASQRGRRGRRARWRRPWCGAAWRGELGMDGRRAERDRGRAARRGIGDCCAAGTLGRAYATRPRRGAWRGTPALVGTVRERVAAQGRTQATGCGWRRVAFSLEISGPTRTFPPAAKAQTRTTRADPTENGSRPSRLIQRPAPSQSQAFRTARNNDLPPDCLAAGGPSRSFKPPPHSLHFSAHFTTIRISRASNGRLLPAPLAHAPRLRGHGRVQPLPAAPVPVSLLHHRGAGGRSAG